MSIKTTLNGKDWRNTCSNCKGWIDLNQPFNPSQMQEDFIENHKYCGQGWDKQYSLIPEKHHYLCECRDCTGGEVFEKVE